eukprot:140505_1
MSCDQFALWLDNRDMIDELYDDTLIYNKQKIMQLFGGLREIIKLILQSSSMLNLLKHYRLFKMLTLFKTEQQKHHKITNWFHSNNEHKSIQNNISLCNLQTLCISSIYTFLNTNDHFSLQKTCKRLTIIGRKRESINSLSYKQLLSYFTDQFGLWLTNRYILTQLNDNTLQLKTQTIIEFFGGIRRFLILIIQKPYTINLMQHQNLQIILNKFKIKQRKLEMCKITN